MITKKCPVCGKEFYPPSTQWAYKSRRYNPKKSKNDETKYFCSWSCYKKAK